MTGWDWEKIQCVREAKRKICTGDPTFAPDFPRLRPPPLENKTSILDFGCGIGRNIPYLINNFKAKVHGYDFPNMIALAREYLGPEVWNKIVWIEPPVSNLKKHRFDLVLASLVFQHIPLFELRAALRILSETLVEGGELYVHSRGYTDDNYNVWKIVREFFDPLWDLDADDMSERHQFCLFGAKKR